MGVALQRYCNILIGIFIGNFVLNMLTTGLMNMGLSSSLQDTASGIFLLIIMIFTYNSQRVLDYFAVRKERAALAKQYGAR